MTRAVARAVAMLAACASACSFPTKIADPTGAFACLGQPDPTIAPATVTIAGNTIDEVDGMPVTGVAVTGYFQDVSEMVFMGSSGSGGSFSESVSTGMIPRNAHVVATETGYETTDMYPGAPIAGDVNLLVPMFSQADLTSLQTASMQTLDPSKAQGIVLVFDCNQKPLAGATVTVDPPAGAIIYGMQNAPALGQTETDDSGLVFVLNLTPGTITVTASVGDTKLPTRTTSAGSGEVLVAFTQP